MRPGIGLSSHNSSLISEAEQEGLAYRNEYQIAPNFLAIIYHVTVALTRTKTDYVRSGPDLQCTLYASHAYLFKATTALRPSNLRARGIPGGILGSLPSPVPVPGFTSRLAALLCKGRRSSIRIARAVLV